MGDPFGRGRSGERPRAPNSWQCVAHLIEARLSEAAMAVLLKSYWPTPAPASCATLPDHRLTLRLIASPGPTVVRSHGGSLTVDGWSISLALAVSGECDERKQQEGDGMTGDESGSAARQPLIRTPLVLASRDPEVIVGSAATPKH